MNGVQSVKWKPLSGTSLLHKCANTARMLYSLAPCVIAKLAKIVHWRRWSKLKNKDV